MAWAVPRPPKRKEDKTKTENAAREILEKPRTQWSIYGILATDSLLFDGE